MATHNDLLAKILIWLIPGVPAIILHEVAHGWVAEKFGDSTARMMGRLSLNPLRHIDPLGTLVIPGLMLLAHMPFTFGWAKPVPVDFQRLRHGRFGTLCVALAGPLANLAMLFGWLLALFVIGFAISGNTVEPESIIGWVAATCIAGMGINLALMLLNLIPIPPLDGGRILGALLPEAWVRPYMHIERYGILILLVLIMTGAFSLLFQTVIDFIFTRLGLA